MVEIRLHLGDCLEVMRGMAPDSVESIVTDPPYGLQFMGKNWDGGVPGPAFWQAALQVAKPGAHLLAFGGTRTFHRLAVALEDAGWEIRDTIMWVYGSGFPKSLNLDGEWAGWGTALKPAWEPIIMARKPLQGTVAANVQRWGTGAINIDASRIGAPDGHGGGRKGSSGFCGDHYEHDGFVASCVGRWPANLIHDGSDEVVGMFPVSASGSGRRPAGATAEGFSTVQCGPHNLGTFEAYPDAGSGSAARFFYAAKASKADRDQGCEGMDEQIASNALARASQLKGEEATCISNAHLPRRNYHPTVKPTALMRYLCRLVTPPGGLVLDPFMGSGSTGKAAVQEGFGFCGIEIDPGYFAIAQRRIADAQAQLRLPLDAARP